MAQVKLSDKDVDALIRVVATEADHKLMWSHPDDYTAQVHGIVDTILNRVASGKWGDSVAEVANAKNQFSAINGPKGRDYEVYGSVDKVPDVRIPDYLPNIVTSWLTKRGSGTPSSVGGGLNYANPNESDESNRAWVNALDGPHLGYGRSIHYHGTAPGLTPIEAQVVYGGGYNRLEAIHDHQALQQGFGDIAPVPLERPAYFNETGEPPVPMPYRQADVVQTLRQRLDAIPPQQRDVLSDLRDRLRPEVDLAQQLARPPVAIEATPRLLDDGTVSANGPTFDPISNSFTTGGVGSLLDGSIPPSMPNPKQPSLSAGVEPLNFSPAGPRTGTLSTGKQVEIGKLYPSGGFVYRADDAGDGKAVMTKVNDAVLEDVASGKSMLAGAGRGMIGDALKSGAESAGQAGGDVLEDLKTRAGSLAGGVGGFLGGLFGGEAKAAPVPPETIPPSNDQTSWNTTSRDSVAQAEAGRASLSRGPTFQPEMLGRGRPTTVTKTIMVPNPDYGRVNPTAISKLQDIHDKEDARIIAAQTPVPQFIPKKVTQTVVAPVPATMSPGLAASRRKAPVLPGMVPGAVATPRAEPDFGTGMFGLINALVNDTNRRIAINTAVAQQARKDPAGFAIGEANRASPVPTYDVSGGNNAFNPASVQNSSRWQTGY